jgi:Leucine-rich repeat (LRR) protein
MGCCASRGGGDGQYAASNASKREQAWRRTGIVGLRDAGLHEIPSVVFSDADLSKVVKTLDASNNKLTRVPETIGNLTDLRRLTLTRNRITALPEDLGKCANLRTLVLDANRLHETFSTAVDSCLFFARLSKLKTLSLRENGLTVLPDSIGCLVALTTLDVSGNALRALPSTIGRCVALESLDASRQPPASSSESFRVPEELGECPRLTSLVLDGCSVQTVPSAILAKCERLVTLSLHGCPVDVGRLEETEGWRAHAARVRGKHFKKIAGGAMIVGARGLDDGVD